MRGVSQIAAGVTLTFALAACGGSKDHPVKWADSVCGALQPFGAAVRQFPNRNSTREAFTDYFGSLADAAGRARAKLDSVGESPINGGDRLVAKYKLLLDGSKTAFSSAKAKIERISDADPQALITVFTSITSELEASALPVELQNAVSSYPDVENAAKQAPNCQALPTRRPH